MVVRWFDGSMVRWRESVVEGDPCVRSARDANRLIRVRLTAGTGRSVLPAFIEINYEFGRNTNVNVAQSLVDGPFQCLPASHEK